MEVVVAPPPPTDFNFDSNCSTPYITAPSSPQYFGNFFSTTPTRASSFHPNNNNIENEDFEFHFTDHLQRPSLSADELFHGGKIRPLKLTNNASSSSTTSDHPKNNIAHVAFHNKGTRKGSSSSPSRLSQSDRHTSTVCCDTQENDDDDDKDVSSSSASNKKKTTAYYASFLSSISFTKGYRKWRLKDFLLFRSASEGRATDKDPLRRYTVLSKTTPYEDVRVSSFRSTDSSGSVSRRRGPVSAHELHYTVNRAASEELKKKTLLPYKQGLLGCLGFNPGMHHISTRIGSMERS